MTTTAATDAKMLEQIQQMAANMAASVPQLGQNNNQSAKTEQGESFKDLVERQSAKTQDTKDSNPASDSAAVKPKDSAKGKVITNMKDPRIKAMDPGTQAQIVAGFLTPIECQDGSVMLLGNMEPCAYVVPVQADGQPDWNAPIVFTNANGEQFEVQLDLENGNHELFRIVEDGTKQQIDLFPEQPKAPVADVLKGLDMQLATDRQVAGLRGTITELEPGTQEEDGGNDDLAGEALEQQPVFKDAEGVPVKVGENYTLDTEQPDMEAQLARQISQAAQEGLKQVEIKLSPENLGALTIKLTQSSDGSLQVILSASSNKAANLLNQHLGDLNLALQGFGHSEVKVEVQNNGNSQQADQQQYQQTDPDGHNRQQQQQQQQRQQENSHSEDFIQRLRLGLFGLEDIF